MAFPDPMGQQPRRAGKMGKRDHRLPLDRCHYDPTQGGGENYQIYDFNPNHLFKSQATTFGLDLGFLRS